MIQTMFQNNLLGFIKSNQLTQVDNQNKTYKHKMIPKIISSHASQILENINIDYLIVSYFYNYFYLEKKSI